MKRYYFFCLTFLLNSTTLHPFANLKDLQQYATEHTEQPPGDFIDWTDPDYSDYHRSLEPRLITRLLHKIGLGTIVTTGWQPERFKELLLATTKQRTQKGWNGETIAYVPYSKPTRLFVWGDLHGSFHSFVRALTYLHKGGVITQDLHISDPAHYFVFNGDAINRSGYTLEMLNLLLLLLHKNPDQVVYIRGKHEAKGHWLNYALERELKIRLRRISNDITPLENEIKQFFDTLPIGLYISTADKRTDLIRISHIGRKKGKLNEEFFGSLFNKAPADTLTYRQLKDKDQKEQPFDVRVIVKTENWRKEQRAQTGLGQLDQDLGATSWTVLSSPIPVHQKHLDFFYDAFAIIDCTLPLRNSTITLCNRDVRTKDDFMTHTAYNIITGAPADANTTTPQKDLLIGSSMALVSGVAVMGEQIKRGISVRINKENRQGGVKGYHLRTRIYNDNYEPHLARQNVKRLVQEGATILLLPVGSPTFFAYKDFVEDKKIAVLFPITGGSQFRTPDLKGVVHLRNTYEDEVRALMDFSIKEFATRKFAFFFQGDAYGQSATRTAHEVLKEKNITQGIEIPYTRGATDFSEQVEKLTNAQVDAIGLFATAGATHSFLRKLGIHRLANKKLFGISFLGEESLRQFGRKHNTPILFGAVVPNPWTSDLEIVKEYRAEMDNNNLTYDAFSLEAYMGTSILIDMLNKIEGEPTKDAVLQQLESLQNYKFKGLELTFNPQRRDLTDYVWIETSTAIPQTVSTSFAQATKIDPRHSQWVRKKVKR